MSPGSPKTKPTWGERTNNSKNKSINTEGRLWALPQHLINMALLTLNCLKTDGRGNIAAHKHWAPLSGSPSLPLVLWKDIITGKWHHQPHCLPLEEAFLVIFCEVNHSPSGSLPGSLDPVHRTPAMKQMKLNSHEGCMYVPTAQTLNNDCAENYRALVRSLP